MAVVRRCGALTSTKGDAVGRPRRTARPVPAASVGGIEVRATGDVSVDVGTWTCPDAGRKHCVLDARAGDLRDTAPSEVRHRTTVGPSKEARTKGVAPMPDSNQGVSGGSGTPPAGAPAKKRPGCGLSLIGIALIVIGVVAASANAGAGAGGALVIGIVLAIVGVLRFAFDGATTPSARGATSSPAGDGQGHPSRAEPVHQPEDPDGEAVQAWVPRGAPVEVVGEAWRTEAFRSIFPSSALARDDGVETDAPAELSDDSANPYDRNAVAVWVRHAHVGYLDREHAAVWHPLVAEMAARAQHLVVPARTWAVSRDGRIHARVTITLPNPAWIDPYNGLPEADHVVLPIGAAIQVTKEDEHIDVLARYAATDGRPVAVTLHPIHEMRPRSCYETVEVQIDRERVGVLSATQAANLLPLVKHVTERGKMAVARGLVSGNSIKAEVVLYVAKAAEVDQAWLDALGPVAPRTAEYEPRPHDDMW